METRDVVARRLASQFLTTKGPGNAADLIRALGVVQAQDYAGAKWALGQRIAGSTDADIERGMTEGLFLRTHVLRPTWHFVAPEDIRWMLTLSAPRISRIMSSYDRTLGLTPAVYRRGADVIARALEGGKFLTRAELAQALERAQIRTDGGQRLARLVMYAETAAVICSGPRRGKQFTYALMDERVPKTAPLERDEALRALALRYFPTRGPATAHDFAWWSGLTVGDARRAIGMTGKDLQRTTLNDRDAWFVERRPPRTKPVAHLLPNYDEYFIGYKDRSAIGHRIKNIAAVTGGNALIAHVVFVNGDLVGGWKRADEAKHVAVKMKLVTKIAAAERGLINAALKRLGAFLGRTVRATGL